MLNLDQSTETKQSTDALAIDEKSARVLIICNGKRGCPFDTAFFYFMLTLAVTAEKKLLHQIKTPIQTLFQRDHRLRPLNTFNLLNYRVTRA
jgi:hypothetical protein